MAWIPQRLLTTAYAAARTPGRASGLDDGANCQHYAYEVLRSYGFTIGELRSAELWDDREFTISVDTMATFDLVLFNATGEPFGAHVGVYIAPGKVLHLCREVARPAVWTLDEFASRPRYAVRIGAKRPIRRYASGSPSQ
jgi:hypothetical protein